MTTRRDFLKKSGLALAAATVGSITPLSAATGKIRKSSYKTNRPPLAKRNFSSKAVEELIVSVKAKLKDPKLAWMFENCFPNTLDTTINFKMNGTRPDTFVITGDIDAMWLRDSAAQVWPYLPLCKNDEPLRLLIAGVINRQTRCIQLDPYANAFYADDTKESEWKSDMTEMKKGLHERKWEIDSLCYPVRLAYHYWKTTDDTSVFHTDWQKAMGLIYKTFTEQQRKANKGPYRFMRAAENKTDTLACYGWGQPVMPVGLIVSCFRPSDDSTDYGFLIPSNFFAVTSLHQIAEIYREVIKEPNFAEQCEVLAKEVENALQRYAVFTRENIGKVYAYEADGFGNATFMDDTNVPSLLALPYLGCVPVEDEIYQNTRKLVWSENNPYFFKGTLAEGIGGPHIGYEMVWPMSMIVRALTSTDDDEIKHCIRTIRDTDANTGFIHESFHQDDCKNFTRSWFAWANTLFGELIVKTVNEDKIELLNTL